MRETTKKRNVKLLSHPKITESGVYDVVFNVNGEVVEREFEVEVIISYHHPYGYENEVDYVFLIATCCNEDDEGVAEVMECLLEEVAEDYIWSL